MTDPANQTPSEPKLVPEKDLLAMKAAKEGLEQKLKEAEVKLEESEKAHGKSLNEVTSKLYATEASVKKLEEQAAESAKSVKDLAEVKAKLEVTEKKAGEHSAKLLDARKRLVVSQFNIPADTLKDKSLEQLDLYEEALKAVTATKGVGNYAAGGGAGSGAAEAKAREKIRSGFDALHPTDK